ncbi:MAG: amidohydrolase family protein [Citromicrobium sp.]|nr:amidohydrolase family protein [Citromicrobium sp.]
MVTEANHDSWTPNDLSPYVEHVADCFGLDRVMYGSDWPVCTLAGSYGQVISALKTILKPRPAATASISTIMMAATSRSGRRPMRSCICWRASLPITLWKSRTSSG